MPEIKYFGSFDEDHGRPSPSLSPEEQTRVEALLSQKDTERKEWERITWRKASEPPAMQEREMWTPPPATPLTPAKPEPGFFAKLKLGKFLE